VESNAEIQQMLNRLVGPQMRRTLELLRRALPEVPIEVLRRRVFITVTNVVHGAGDAAAAHDSPLGDLARDNPLEMVHALFEYMTAAVSAPALPMTPEIETRLLRALVQGAERTP